MLNKEDIAVLREVASRYAEIAALPVHNEKRNLWLKLNHLHMERPMLLIDQIPWNEMDVDGSLQCKVSDPYWRGVEWEMRTEIYKFIHMPADKVFNPYVCLSRPVRNTGWGINSKAKVLTHVEGETAHSYSYENQITSLEDVEKIQMPVITVDTEMEARILEEAKTVFDGIIDYKLTGQCMHLGLWDVISGWKGVESCYFDIIDEPELIHAIMEKMTQGTIGMINQMNELKLFDINSHVCHCSQVFLNDMPKEEDIGLSGNAWAFGLAQLFSSVSPAVTDEFEVQYMKRIFPYFGAVYYGCCDRLDDRMDVIRKLPKIRKLSCSPWSVREHFAEVMPDYCVMSNKPNPAFLASGEIDEQLVRDDIRRTINAAKQYGRNLEIILKDISTVAFNPSCLWKWHDIVMDEIQK